MSADVALEFKINIYVRNEYKYEYIKPNEYIWLIYYVI